MEGMTHQRAQVEVILDDTVKQGWTRVRAGDWQRHGERGGGTWSAARVAGGGLLLVACAAAATCVPWGAGSQHNGQHPSSLAQAHAVGIKGTQALSMESKKEYKLAQLKGEIAQLEVKARDAKLILGHMKDALSQKMSPGALADEPRTERALAVKLEHLSTMYRIKSDLARAEFANEGKDGLPDSERLKTEGEIQDDMMYASMLAKRSKEAEQLAMQDRLVASKLIGFHDQYQLLMGEDREKAKLDSATVELKEAKKELAEKQDKILEATKLPDERSSADAVKEAMAIEKLQGKAGR